MKNKSFHNLLSTVLQCLALICFIGSLIYIPIRTLYDSAFREEGEFRLMLVQCSLGLFAACIPLFLPPAFKEKLPRVFSSSLCAFLIASIFLGDVVGFYTLIPQYDSYLHFISGVLLFICGTAISKHFFDANKLVAIALFSICFALASGCVWEIYEFTFDGILGLNMQRHSAVVDGAFVPKLGREALVDTAKDLILDLLGAISACFFYVSATRKISPGGKRD